MFKKVVSAVFMTGMVTMANAGDDLNQVSEQTQPFIGVEIGGTMVQGDTGGLLGEKNHDGTGASIGIRLGAQNQQWRSMLMFDYYNKDDDDQNYERLLVQVDYFVMPSSFNETSFRPYIGINGGYLNYESTGIDESGFTYGGQLGFTAAITQDIDFDLSYRYSVTDFDELDNIGNVAFGINYLY